MLARWGAAQYGMFALSSSLVVSMGLLDGGVRVLTRIRLAEALKEGDQVAYRNALGSGVVSFACVAFAASFFAAALAASGLLSAWFHLPVGGEWLLLTSMVLTCVFMITNLALEPLAARENLSALKAANTWGAISSIPLCAAAVWLGASVFWTTILYMACIIIPNFVLLLLHKIHDEFPWRDSLSFHPRMLLETLRSGVWYYLTTVSLVLKGHGFTFLVSALLGPAAAGLFYILLRLTEVITNLGTTASETSLASLATAHSNEERRLRFHQSWLYVTSFCLYASVSLTLLGEPILRRWLPGHPKIVHGLGVSMAIFGLTSALSRVSVNASMGLGNIRGAAIANIFEAVINLGLAVVGFYIAGLPGILLGGSLGIFVMIPTLRKIADLCGDTFLSIYLAPLRSLIPGLLISATLNGMALMSQSPPLWILALAASGILLVRYLRGFHKVDGLSVGGTETAGV